MGSETKVVKMESSTAEHELQFATPVKLQFKFKVLEGRGILDELLVYIDKAPKTEALAIKDDFKEGKQLDSMRTFNLLFFSDSLKRFVESLDYFVAAWDFGYRVAKYDNVILTVQVCLIGLIIILWFEIFIPFTMLLLAMYSMYNKYH
jgi:hypothetical protein